MYLVLVSKLKCFAFFETYALHNAFTPCQVLDVDLDDEPIITGESIREPDASQVAVKEEDTRVC